MGAVAFMFSGQGAQYSGMGKTLYESSPAARAVFGSLDSIRPGTSDMCFCGSEEELKQTINTQPCLYAVEMAAAAAMDIRPAAVAGFSLGEVSALAYAGVFSTEDGFRAVIKRSELMQRETENLKSAMTAVLKLSDEDVAEAASKYSDVFPVNFNSPGQVVCAGSEESIASFEKDIAAKGGRAMRLAVSGGFHSPFMKSASEKFEKELGNFKAGETVLPVYANLTGRVYPGNVKDMLVKQMVNPVRWTDTVRNMIGDGIDTFVEIGPGRTLSSLVKRIDRSVKTLNVSDTESFDRVLSSLGGV